MTHPFKQLINGLWTDALNGGVWEVKNPATEETITTVPFGDDKDCLAAIDSAKTGFEIWSKTNPFDRAVILKKAAELMFARIDEFARITVTESGKPIAEAAGEWKVAAGYFEWYAEEGKRSYGKVIPAARNNKRMMVIHQPVGVIGAVTAWNFPSYNPARCWAAALGAGCAVVAKASEYTPLTAMLMAGCLQEAGLPPGV
ncbi:MAG: aldehyde dehydrogenase family protein, partial [Cyclobacteriaceae bacterium]